MRFHLKMNLIIIGVAVITAIAGIEAGAPLGIAVSAGAFVWLLGRLWKAVLDTYHTGGMK